MTHKEFYFWLEGFLNGKSELTYTEITVIQKKMEKINEDVDYSGFIKNRSSSEIFNPIQVKIKDDDNLGKPPKIVM